MVWGMLKNSRKASGPRMKRPLRLELERLERRDCPSPVITTFSASPTLAACSRQVELRGTVSDDHPEHDTVTFSGMATGSVMPDIYGNFDYFTTGFGLGTVTAVATKYPGNQSGPAMAMITQAPPSITSFQVVSDGDGCWTFSGSVADPANTLGMVVKFCGNFWVNGLSATVDQHGNFSATFYLPQMKMGFVSAETWDVWGQASGTIIDPLI